MALSDCNWVTVEPPKDDAGGGARCEGAAVLPAAMWANSAAAALWTVLLIGDSSAVTKGA